MQQQIKNERFRFVARKSADWIRNGVVYEIFLRSFSKKGNIDGMIDKLQTLKALGITILWLMPIHPIGRIHRKGRLGSPYSVKDYYKIHSNIGNIGKLKHLVHECHKHRLHIIIDLVIGHTAWDNQLFLRHPEWYKKDKTGKFGSPDPAWTDVVALDYSNRDLVKHMLKLMKYWVGYVRVDGFRCDDAGRVPLRFWEKARKILARKRPILMIAESDRHPYHHRNAFDLSYGTDFYIALKEVINGRTPATRLHEVIEMELSKYPKGSILLRFTSNHDKNIQEGSDTEVFGLRGAKLAAVVNNTIPGVPMLYNGQETGNQNRLDLFNSTKIQRNNDMQFSRLYKHLFTIRRVHPALIDGRFIRIPTSDDQHIFTFCRVLIDDCILIAANFSKRALSVKMSLPSEVIIGREVLRCTNLLTGQRVVTKDVNDGSFELKLPSFGYLILSL